MRRIGRVWRALFLCGLLIASFVATPVVTADTVSQTYEAPFTRGQVCYDPGYQTVWLGGVWLPLECVSTPKKSLQDVNYDVEKWRRYEAAGLASHGYLFVDSYRPFGDQFIVPVKGTGVWGGRVYETSTDQFIGKAASSGTIDVDAELIGAYTSHEFEMSFQICLQVLEEFLAVVGQDCINDGETVRDLQIVEAPIIGGKSYWIHVSMNDLGDSSEGYARLGRLTTSLHL